MKRAFIFLRFFLLTRIAIAALLSSVFLIGSASASIILPNGFELFNTGNEVGVGGVDQHYFLTLNPFNGSSDAFVGSAAYLSANTLESAWLSPRGPSLHVPESVYRLATEIDLTGIDLSSFALVGYWLSDNQGLDILVNGNSTGQTNNGAHSLPVDAFASNRFTLSSHLTAGMNTIEFVWGNGPAGGANSQFPNPAHIRVQFLVPEPSSLTLLGLALTAMVACRLGRRPAAGR